MPLNETIIKRKSIRNYTDEALSSHEISDICECIHNIEPLIGDIAYTIKILDKTEFKEKYSAMFSVNSPNYAVVHSESKKGSNLNAGYVAQNLVLGLTANNYGTCFMGGAKQKEKGELPLVIVIALGKTEQAFRVSEVDAERKKMEDIADGDLTTHMEGLRAARIAPSAMNLQPVRYLCMGEKLHIFRSKAKSMFGMMDKLQSIDTGIAIANIMAAEPKYKFGFEENAPNMRGGLYMGTLTLQQ